MKLSILMPVYNERATLASAIKEVLNVRFPCEVELVVVDDGSTDGTRDLYPLLGDDPRVKIYMHEHNQGKGAAIRTAAAVATGDYLIVCDADLEYTPNEIPLLLAPVIAGDAQVVYGTRTFGSHNCYSYSYVLGNKLVTTFANILFNCYISDMETCFKLIPVALYRQLGMREAGFGMDPEITGKLLRRGIRPYEVPISYRARSREAGKKLTSRDGLEAVWILLRQRFGRLPRLGDGGLQPADSSASVELVQARIRLSPALRSHSRVGCAVMPGRGRRVSCRRAKCRQRPRIAQMARPVPRGASGRHEKGPYTTCAVWCMAMHRVMPFM